MEEFRQTIEEIEARIQKMNASLSHARSTNMALNKELEVLNDKLEQREIEVLDFKTKYDTVKNQFEYYAREVAKKKVEKDSQIDELVREIDECINRLKAN